jgi:hypothetical protein
MKANRRFASFTPSIIGTGGGGFEKYIFNERLLPALHFPDAALDSSH